MQDPAQIKRRNIDYMCPILDWVKPENITACEEAGLKMWMYTSLEPWKEFLNLRVDNLLWEPRLLFWQMAQMKLTGFLYWYALCHRSRSDSAPVWACERGCALLFAGTSTPGKGTRTRAATRRATSRWTSRP